MKIHKPGDTVHLSALGIDFPLTRNQTFVNFGCLETLDDGFRKVQLALEDAFGCQDYLADERKSMGPRTCGYTCTAEYSDTVHISMFWIKMPRQIHELFTQGHEETHVLDRSKNLGKLHGRIKNEVGFEIDLENYSIEHRADIGGIYALMRDGRNPPSIRDFLPYTGYLGSRPPKEVKNLIRKYETVKHFDQHPPRDI